MKTDMTENNNCPICSNTSFVLWRFGLLRCVNCGLIVSPNIFQSGVSEALNKAAFGPSYKIERSFWVCLFDILKNRRYLYYLRKWGGITRGELLEVGIGNGSFLCAARSAGFQVNGSDLSEYLCSLVQKSTGIPIHCGHLEELPPKGWDVVVMAHVVEHVNDPVAFLQAARKRLKPGGFVFITVPNIACWEAVLPGWNSYEPYHMCYFTIGTLLASLEKAGFKVLKIVTHDTFSALFLALFRTLAAYNRVIQIHSSPIRWRESKKTMMRIFQHPYSISMVITGIITWPLRVVMGRLG